MKLGRNCFCKLFVLQQNILWKSAQNISVQLSKFSQHEPTFVAITEIKIQNMTDAQTLFTPHLIH